MHQKRQCMPCGCACAQLHVSDPALQCKLFNSLVLPILSHACEVWAVDLKTQPLKSNTDRFRYTYGKVLQMKLYIGLISPVQHVYPCSETQHRHQRAWRCGTTQQVEQHTFLCSSLPPKKVNVAHRKGRTSAQVFYSMTGVKAGVQVQGMPVR